MSKRGHKELEIRFVLQLEAVLERTGLDTEGLRHMIAFEGFPAATLLQGREVWDMDAVIAWCEERGVPLPAKYQASLNRLIDGLANEVVREHLEELKIVNQRGRRRRAAGPSPASRPPR